MTFTKAVSGNEYSIIGVEGMRRWRRRWRRPFGKRRELRAGVLHCDKTYQAFFKPPSARFDFTSIWFILKFKFKFKFTFIVIKYIYLYILCYMPEILSSRPTRTTHDWFTSPSWLFSQISPWLSICCLFGCFYSFFVIFIYTFIEQMIHK